jgi:aldehyde dehydrogenase (NAD+)
MTIAREEIFGPVASILSFDDIDDVIERTNRTNYGLGCEIWTRDISKAHRLAHDIQAGVVWVNCYGMGDPAVPFGGYKMSGWGREMSLKSLDDYLNTKAVWIRTD